MAPKQQTAVVVNAAGGTDVFKLVHDHPVPERQPRQLLVRIQSTSVNPVDTYLRTGSIPPEGGYPKVS